VTLGYWRCERAQRSRSSDPGEVELRIIRHALHNRFGDGTVELVLSDNNVLFAESLSVLLAKRGHVVVGRAASADEALAQFGSVQADAWLTDFHFGERDAYVAIQRLRETLPTMPVLILTAECDRDALQRALEAGADAVALKTESIEEVERLLRRVASPTFQSRRAHTESGGKAWSHLARSLDRTSRRRPSGTELTRRERDVLDRVCVGRRTEEIAESMGVGLSTVRTHMQHLYSKLNVHSRLELIAYAARNRLFEDEPALDDAGAA
jgi:two-component system nitrate/nitrite response regulator NarL